MGASAELDIWMRSPLAILLIGLGANALLGWWWADPVAGLVMVPINRKEGVEAIRGEACGCDKGLG